MPGAGAVSVTPPSVAPAPMPAVTATAYDDAFIAAHLARLQTELGCGTPQVPPDVAHFCLAIAWPTGSAAPLPGGARVLAGVTSWVPTTAPVVEGLRGQRRFSCLALRSDASGIAGELISPSSRNGDPAPLQAMETVEQALRGNSPGPLPIMRQLFNYISSRSIAAEYPAVRTAQGWQLAGGSIADIRRVGSVWVAIEVPRNNPAGLYLSLFVDNELVGVGL